jgi:hypothetical protein
VERISGMSTVRSSAAVGGAITGWMCAGFGVGLGLLGRVLFDWSSTGRTAAVSIFGILGCLLGGFRAGLLERRAPLSNGAAAGVLTTVPLSVIGIVQNPSRLASAVFALLLGASFGTFGGMVSNGSSRRRPDA